MVLISTPALAEPRSSLASVRNGVRVTRDVALIHQPTQICAIEAQRIGITIANSSELAVPHNPAVQN